jgi:hypothetical protein
MQVLVIARVKPGTPMEQVLPFVSPKVVQAWEFYASEQIRQIYYIADMSGAVMVWEGESVESVTQQVQKLPMVMEITNGQGANIIFDSVAGSFIETLANAAAKGATIFEYGSLSSEATPFPVFPALQKGLKVQAYTLFEITIADAHRYMESNQQQGKITITVS